MALWHIINPNLGDRKARITATGEMVKKDNKERGKQAIEKNKKREKKEREKDSKTEIDKRN